MALLIESAIFWNLGLSLLNSPIVCKIIGIPIDKPRAAFPNLSTDNFVFSVV